MYRKQLSAQESLEAIKLRMKYDLKKTLNENSSSLNIIEQDNSKKTNTLTDEDLIGSTNKLRQYFQLVTDYNVLFKPFGFNPVNLVAGKRVGVKGVVDALDGFVDVEGLGFVLQTIKSLDGKCYFDDIENKNISATQRFLELYQEDEGEDLVADIDSVGTDTLKTGAEKIKQRIKKAINDQVAKGCSTQETKAETNVDPNKPTQRQQHINNMWCSLKNGIITAGGRYNGKKWEDYTTAVGNITKEEIEVAKKSCPNNSNNKVGGKNKKTVNVPSELKTVDGIKHFQDWLDTNHPGWASGYTDGVLLKGKNGGGYGAFGPRTSKAWASYKTDYLSGKTTSKVGVDAEEGGTKEVFGDNPKNILANN